MIIIAWIIKDNKIDYEQNNYYSLCNNCRAGYRFYSPANQDLAKTLAMKTGNDKEEILQTVQALNEQGRSYSERLSYLKNRGLRKDVAEILLGEDVQVNWVGFNHKMWGY